MTEENLASHSTWAPQRKTDSNFSIKVSVLGKEKEVSHKGFAGELISRAAPEWRSLFSTRTEASSILQSAFQPPFELLPTTGLKLIKGSPDTPG